MITRSDKDLTEENNQHLDSLFSSLIHLLVIMAWFSFNTHTLFRLTTRVCVLKENQAIDWSSRILKGKQKLGVTFNFDKLGSIHFTNFSNWTMCRASEA